MKKVFGKSYLAFIGISVAVAFAVVAIILRAKFNEHADKIGKLLENSIFQHKYEVVRDEFDHLEQNMRLAGGVFDQASTLNDIQARVPALKNTLFSDAKVERCWYVTVDGRDSSFHYFIRRSGALSERPFPRRLKSWIAASPHGEYPGKCDVKALGDSLYLFNIGKKQAGDGSRVIYGYDIDFAAMASYFFNVDDLSYSYFFLVDDEGRILVNPDIQRVGKRMRDDKHIARVQHVVQGRKTEIELGQSEYLQLPVKRSYMDFPFEGRRWVMIVSVPVATLTDEVVPVRNYLIILGIGSVAVILLIVMLAQSRWQREFSLRQEVLKAADKLKLQAQELQLKAERNEKENALLQLQELKEKIDPHFLFNSFGSLNVLIDKDPQTAKKFIVKLSKVYRYILDADVNYLPTVEEELDIALQYYFLLKIRFRDALSEISTKIHPDDLLKRVPFMSIQTLIENAIKHNEMSKNNPLSISIESDGNCLIVKNNYQARKQQVVSGKQGLTYLSKTYQYFKGEAFRAEEEGEFYVCYLPLL